MFLLTNDQSRLLMVLEKTGCLRLEQVQKILNDQEGGYTSRVLRQMGYMQKAYPKPDGTVTLPHLSGCPPDGDLLAATDIMLDVAGGAPLALSLGKPPYLLRFLTETESYLGSYAVAVVHRGDEQLFNFHAGDAGNSGTALLLLDTLSQRERLRPPKPYYYAVFDGTYRYFEG
jgi:hypothetical protein